VSITRLELKTGLAYYPIYPFGLQTQYSRCQQFGRPKKTLQCRPYMCSLCGTPPNTEAQMPRKKFQGGIPLLSPIHRVCSLQLPSSCLEQSLLCQNKNITGIPKALYSPVDKPRSSSTSVLNTHRTPSIPNTLFTPTHIF
jgi:hypothetical protein